MRAGMELTQATVFLARSIQEQFAYAPITIRTASEFWALCRQPASMEMIRLRHFKLEELRPLATVSHPGICTRPAQLASKVNIP